MIIIRLLENLLWRFPPEEKVYHSRECCKSDTTPNGSLRPCIPCENTTGNKTRSNGVDHVILGPVLGTPPRFSPAQSTIEGEKEPLTDSITHSMPANRAPTFAKPFPLRHIPLPISLKISEAFCVVDNAPVVCCRSSGSSYAKDADINEKNAPIAKPKFNRFGF